MSQKRLGMLDNLNILNGIWNNVSRLQG